VDLFVRESNHAGIQMYQKFGYTIYWTVLDYDNGTENGLDMQNPMKRDADLMSIKSPTRAKLNRTSWNSINASFLNPIGDRDVVVQDFFRVEP